MNNKGFAITGIVYSVLILFFLLVFAILGILGSRKMVLDKLKNEVMNELNDEVANNIYKDNSGANYPRLLDNMIPVLYDNEKSSWVYADIYEKWYDYDEKMWANAIVLKKGVTKVVGQTISEDDIALMYVWIPRYKYVLFNAHNESVEEQQIDITFEKGTNKTGTVKCIDAINQTDAIGNKISEICIDTVNNDIVNNASTYTHPAFTFGEDEIEGFWVGKFENSTTDEVCLNEANETNCNKESHIIEIKANSDSLRYINISNMFNSILNITNNYGINNADSHMIKNMEWGAIAYLTQSKHGRCTNGVCEEVTINNVLKNETTYTTQTGCAANEISGEVSNVCQNEYNTLKGIKASTTGNIYGVYDMSGGAWEYTMGNMADLNGNFYSSSSDFINLDKKYYNLYTYGTEYQNHSRGKLGDATSEIMKTHNVINGGWSNSYAYMPAKRYSWFVRGGDWNYNLNSGDVDDGGIGASIFTFDNGTGDFSTKFTSRSILIKK